MSATACGASSIVRALRFAGTADRDDDLHPARSPAGDRWGRSGIRLDEEESASVFGERFVRQPVRMRLEAPPAIADREHRVIRDERQVDLDRTGCVSHDVADQLAEDELRPRDGTGFDTAALEVIAERLACRSCAVRVVGAEVPARRRLGKVREDHDGRVVDLSGSKESVDQRLEVLGSAVRESCEQALLALDRHLLALDQAVGVKRDLIARLQGQREFVEGRVLGGTEHDPVRRQDAGRAASHEDRRRMSGDRYRQPAATLVDERDERGREEILGHEEHAVHEFEGLARRFLGKCGDPQAFAQTQHRCGRRQSVTGDVSHGEDDHPAGQDEGIVPIAADLIRGRERTIHRGEVDPAEIQQARNERGSEGRREVALALVLRAQLFRQPAALVQSTVLSVDVRHRSDPADLLPRPAPHRSVASVMPHVVSGAIAQPKLNVLGPNPRRIVETVCQIIGVDEGLPPAAQSRRRRMTGQLGPALVDVDRLAVAFAGQEHDARRTFGKRHVLREHVRAFDASRASSARRC